MNVLKAIRPHEASNTLQALNQAMRGYHAWLQNMHRAALCKTPLNSEGFDGDAHCVCCFGEWYYRRSHPLLRAHPTFIEIARAHRNMHSSAQRLARAFGKASPLAAADYDHFMEACIEFQELVHHLQFEIQDSLCTTDPLTGVCNRQGMLPALHEEQDRALRTGQTCSISMVDFDHFKQVNDGHGHAVGDQVLRAGVEHFVKLLRPYDSIYRYGGEEFLLCLPHVDAATARASILERLRAGLATLPIVLNNGDTLRITASFGVAQLQPGASIEETIARADAALYAAKRAGRNLICLWGEQR